MGLPADITANDTCDIARGATPTAIASAGVPIFITGAFENIKPTNTYTHIAIFGLDADIRDGDVIWVPQYSINPSTFGTQFTVVHVQRVSRNTPADRFMAYLNRTNTPWPTIEL